jgi:hypothetical protein
MFQASTRAMAKDHANFVAEVQTQLQKMLETQTRVIESTLKNTGGGKPSTTTPALATTRSAPSSRQQ